MKAAAKVWNRAAMKSGGATPRAGDAALSALLLAHGMVTNGGVLHAVLDALKPDELTAACDGFRFFGFDDIAELLALASRTTIDSESDGTFDARYRRSIGDDSVIVGRFEHHFAEHPDLYAPLDGECGEPAHPNFEAMQRAALDWKRRAGRS
jgi:hypothetical protein